MADEAASTAPAASSTPNATISTDATPPAAAAPAPFEWSKAGLAPEHLNLVTERGWKSPDDVMKSYRNLETATGVPPERLVKLPAAKDAANPDVWNKIYTQLGRPETADKYTIPVPEGDKGELAAAMKPILHKAGLSQSQATVLATEWNAMTQAQAKAEQTATDAKHLSDVTALKQAWGTEFDSRSALVDRAAETFGMKQTQLDALKTAMGPKDAMQFLYTIGSKIAVEDTSVPGISGQQAFGLTPESAQAKIASLKHDRDFAALFNSKDAKQRMEARTEMDRLHKLAYPGMTAVGASR